jgi:hypothetical protein
MRRYWFVSIFALTALLLLPPPLSAQTLSMGNLLDASNANSSDANTGHARTDIDLDNPATATGTITSVTYYWGDPCPSGSVSIKFFHRSGNLLTVTADIAADTLIRGFHTIPVPNVPVQQGDLIGIAAAAPPGCGNAFSDGIPLGYGYVQYLSNPGVGTSVNLTNGTGTSFPGRLALQGTGTACESVTHVIAVVGSAAGNNGSFFKTDVQLFNGGSAEFSGPMSGTLLFHPAGASGVSEASRCNGVNLTPDPSYSYTLAPGQVLPILNVVMAMTPTSSGLGTIDLVLPTGHPPPTAAVVRVFNDAGANGTSGLTEELIPVGGPFTVGSFVMPKGTIGFLVTPPDLNRARFNIGVRTLFRGATLTATLNSGTTTIATVTKSYPPSWFEQVGSAAFFSPSDIGPNDSIMITVTSGEAIVYGSTTDNTTNDPAIQFARVTLFLFF